MCLIIVGPGDIKVVIAAPKELFCVCVSVKCPFTLWLCIVTKGEKSWRIMPGSFHGPDLASITSTRVYGHHLFPRPPLTASFSEMCCLDVCPGGRTETIGPELAYLCHTWHMPSALELSCLWSCFPFILFASLYFKLGLRVIRRFPLPTPHPQAFAPALLLLWIIFLRNLRSLLNWHLFTEACS